ncbi:MAG TPA: ribonuclease H-like domain-containing protein [Terriglobia bacterium]|jgi:hypothetical protein
MPDFGKALRGLQRGPKPPATDWKSALANYVTAGFSPRSVLPPGEIQSTAFGSHYFIRAVYPHDHFHGKVALNRLSSADLQSLITLMREEAGVPHRNRILFLDTETTGVQGGTGICPFLVGLGYFAGDDFHMIQFFIRDFDEEPSMLSALAELLKSFDLVVTYNGTTFDIPLLETRFTLARLDNPFAAMSHFDLLFTARRLWRNGHGSCRLVALERELLSFMRGPDIPGAMIPRAYFEYLQRRTNATFRSIFTHNVDDVLSLAALTVHACDRVVFEPAPLDDPLDLYSLARILDKSADSPRSIRLYEMALAGGVEGPAQQKILERLAVLYRRNGEYVAALAMLERALPGAGTDRKFRRLQKLMDAMRNRRLAEL